MVLMGRDVRPSRTNVRHAPPRISPPRTHSCLMVGPRPRRAGHGRRRGGTRRRRVLLRWQAPQPCRSRPPATVAEADDPYVIPYVNPYVIPYALGVRTPSPPRGWISAGYTPSGGVERPGRKVRFARLIHRPGRTLGGPAVRAAFGSNLSLPWLLLRVVPQAYRGPC
jgi:hypothetical protein